MAAARCQLLICGPVGSARGKREESSATSGTLQGPKECTDPQACLRHNPVSFIWSPRTYETRLQSFRQKTYYYSVTVNIHHDFFSSNQRKSFHYDITSLLDRVAVIDLLAGGCSASWQKKHVVYTIQQQCIC